MIFSKSLDQWLLVLGVLVVACVAPVSAQQDNQLTPPKVEGKVMFGTAVFNDDIEHKVVGGAVRIYLTERLSIEPEYLYMRHSDIDQDHVVQPNIAIDITDPRKRFVAYAIAGAGLLHHRGRFFGRDFETGAPRVFDVSINGWTASAGGGVKIFVTDRFFVSPEVRVGREPTFRATVNVGYVFGGRR